MEWVLNPNNCKEASMRRGLALYWSHTGTQRRWHSAFTNIWGEGFDALIKKVQEAEYINFYGYDLICFGVPSCNWHPPKPTDDYLKAKFAHYRRKDASGLPLPT
jgi:hypothetical protein